MAAHLVLHVLEGLAGRVPAAADVAEHLLRDLAAVVALRQHAVQRLALDLGDGVPQRDLDGADRDRALGVAAGFLALHHAGEHLRGIEVAAARVEQRVRRRGLDARDEAGAHLRAAGVAAGGVEGEADDRLAVADDVGDDGDHRGRHFGEVESGVAEVRLQRDRGFADIDDTHGLTGLLQKTGFPIRHPEARAKRASKDGRPGFFLDGSGPSCFEARKSAHLSMTGQSSCAAERPRNGAQHKSLLLDIRFLDHLAPFADLELDLLARTDRACCR